MGEIRLGASGAASGHGAPGLVEVWGEGPLRPIDRRAFVRRGLGALVSPMLMACLPGPTGLEPGTDDGSARITATPGVPTIVPDIGSSRLNLSPTLRDATMYVPSSVDPDEPSPLLVALHGAGGEAGDWDVVQPSCEERGIVLLAVESRGRTWDRVSGIFGPDVVYMEAALRHVFDRCAIDPERIGLFGFSDGASYTISLGPSNGDLFRHLVAFSPGFVAPAGLVGLPRIWVSHGRQDTILPEAVTRNDIVPSFREAGYEVTYRDFEGGHVVPRAIWTEALDWFLA